MTTNELYQAALVAQPYTTARHTLPNGDILFCSIDRVAGRSVVKKHRRTTWNLKLAAEEFSKPVSRNRAAQLLNGA